MKLPLLHVTEVKTLSVETPLFPRPPTPKDDDNYYITMMVTSIHYIFSNIARNCGEKQTHKKIHGSYMNVYVAPI